MRPGEAKVLLAIQIQIQVLCTRICFAQTVNSILPPRPPHPSTRPRLSSPGVGSWGRQMRLQAQDDRGRHSIWGSQRTETTLAQHRVMRGVQEGFSFEGTFELKQEE